MLNDYLELTKNELDIFINSIDKKKLNLASDLIQSVRDNNGRIHVTGIGKPSYVAQYISSLFSSTGTPTYFLDGTEAIHGSAGQVQYNDLVIAISNSGETEELKKALQTIKKLGAKMIGVSGNSHSWLAKSCDIFLFAGVDLEGDNLNKPPRISILAEMIVLQALTIKLQENLKLDETTYYKWHPGGTLGLKIRKEADVN